MVKSFVTLAHGGNLKYHVISLWNFNPTKCRYCGQLVRYFYNICGRTFKGEIPDLARSPGHNWATRHRPGKRKGLISSRRDFFIHLNNIFIIYKTTLFYIKLLECIRNTSFGPSKLIYPSGTTCFWKMWLVVRIPKFTFT